MPQPPQGDSRTEWKPAVICPDAGLALRLRAALGEKGLEEVCFISQYPRMGAIAAVLAQEGSNLCFIDMASNPEHALILVSEAAPALPVVAVHPHKDADLILRCLRVGASEFLSDPTAGQVGEVLERLGRFQAPAEAPKTAGIACCVVPGKAGSGASTLATYLAIGLKRTGASRVLLVDTDPVAGSVSFLLKLKASFHLGDAVRDWPRMDADLWARLAIPCHGIDVLTAPEDPATRLEIDPQAALGLMSFWRNHYDAVVLDLPAGQSPACEFATLADAVLLVTTNELAALHTTRRTMECLEKGSVDRRHIRLLVNRYTPAAGLRREGVEAALKVEPYALLHNDWEAVQGAVLEGRPVAPGSQFGQSLQALAERLLGKEKPVRKRSSLFGLLRR